MAGNSSFRFDDPFDLVHPPDAVAEFVERLTVGLRPVKYTKGTERRSQARYILSMLVDVQPLDNAFELDGDAFRAETLDISTTGIGLIHTQDADTKFLALQLTHPDGEQLQTVMEVLWRRPHGRLSNVGGAFVTRLHSAHSSR